MNRSQLVAAVKNYLGRQNLSSTDVTTMIQSVEGELSRALKEHPRSQRRTYFVQPADDAMIPLPADMMQAITLRTDKANYTQYPPDAREAAKTAGNSFIARGDAFEVFPMPTEPTTFYLDYCAALRPLSTDLDTNWVSTYFSDIYLYGTLKESAIYLKDDGRFQLWQAEFARRAEELIAEGWNQNITTVPRIRLG